MSGTSKSAKLLAGVLVALLAVSMVTSCAPPAAEAPTAEPLIIGTTDSVTDLDPAETYDFHTWEIFHNTADTLLTYVAGTTNLQPGLAEAMPEVSDDGLEYTFKLREGLVFPDGTACNAEAVKWSIDRVFTIQGDPNWLVTSFVDHVEVVDDLTVKFVLQAPVGYFPLLVATTPYTPVSPECYPEAEIDSDSTCGGVGPYKITNWERDIEIELEQNEDYYGTAPAWPNIIVKYFEDSTTMRLALENGEIDVAWKTLSPTDYPELEGNADLSVIEGPGAYIRYLCFNVTSPPVDDPLVRQAIAAAIDRATITDRVFVGTHAPLYSMVPNGMWSHIDAFKEVYGERDLDMAKDLLGQAGYSEDNPLVIDLWYPPQHYGPTEADVAAVIKESLEETGMIQATLQYAEWATYTDYMTEGTMPFFTLGWYPDYLDPDNYTWSWGHSEASDDMGIFYSSATMDAILEEAQITTPLQGDERKAMYEEAQMLWTEDVPTIPFTQGQLLVVTQANVTGVKLDPTMFLHYFLLAK
jgi:peptide/nickel transport system substrate-binding protein